jgi:hypothetical protein
MVQLWGIVLAAGIPSTVTGLLVGWLVKRQNDRDKAREEINILLIQGVGASISLGEAAAIALRDGKTNGETKAALKYAMDTKHNITNFLTRKGVEHIY